MSPALARRAPSPPTGPAVHVVAAEDRDLLVEAADVRERLTARFRSPGYVPPTLPRVALEVMDVARRTDVRIPELVSLLERDPMLVARVLRIANGAVYGGRERTEGLQQAVVRLGLNALRDVVLEAALHMRVFNAPGYSAALEALRRHSVAVAHVSRLVARAAHLRGDSAFVCGMLHDIGIAACILALGDLGPRATRVELAPAWQAVLDIHEGAGAALVRYWGLPADIEDAAHHHHAIDPGEEAAPTTAAVLVADHLATRLGCGLPLPDGAPAVNLTADDPTLQQAGERLSTSSFERACAQLGLADRDRALLSIRARALLEELS